MPPTPEPPIAPTGKIDAGEILDKFPALFAIFMQVKAGIEEAQADGKMTGEELGTVLGNVMRPLGRLVDEIIADAND